MGPCIVTHEYRGFPSEHTTFILAGCEDIPRFSFQCSNPERILNPRHSGQLKNRTKKKKKNYKAQLKCRWKCHVGKTEVQNERYILRETLFSHQLCTFCFIFCLSRNFAKRDMKWLLVTDFISMKTHFRVITTY